MTTNGKLLAFILLLISVSAFVVLGSTIITLVDNSDKAISFRTESTPESFTLEEESSFYLMANINQARSSTTTLLESNCNITRDESSNNVFTCYDEYNFTPQQTFITIQNRNTNVFYSFEGMGNTSVQSGSYSAYGKLTLPPGSYDINAASSDFDRIVYFKLQDRSIIASILIIVFSALIAIAFFIAFIAKMVIAKSRLDNSTIQNSYHTEMKQKISDQDLYDDDPFSKYD